MTTLSDIRCRDGGKKSAFSAKGLVPDCQRQVYSLPRVAYPACQL